jgi:hypothetical protein
MTRKPRITNPQEADQAEIGADTDEPLVVRIPAQLPVLTEQVSRALLAVLIELTTIGVLDGLPTEGRSDVD